MQAGHVELITIGNELLRGDVIDGNAAWLGRRLAAIGVTVVRRATVGDDETAIQQAVAAALRRTGTVLCTGGLGPTSDDVTRAAIAALYRRALHIDETVLDDVRARFTARGVTMPDTNRVQAEVPDGAHVFRNGSGTAPGLALADDMLGLTILLPGVPHEVRWLFDNGVADHLRARWPAALPPMATAIIRTTGISESALYERTRDLVPTVAPVEVAFLPGIAGVDVRLTLKSGPASESALRSARHRFSERLDSHVYTLDERDLAEVVGAALREQNLMLAVAESCTGGLLAKRLTDVPGSSICFAGGFIVYSDELKQRWLEVSPAILREHGAVSEATAMAMAVGALRASGATCALAITGVAGPGGGTIEKPVGTVWVAAAVDRSTGRGSRPYVEARHFLFSGGREEVRERSAQAALRLLQLLLEREGRDPELE
jgi:nicotinamide-nucleotide amidase